MFFLPPCGLGGPSSSGPCTGSYSSSETALPSAISGLSASGPVSGFVAGAGVMAVVLFALFAVYVVSQVFLGRSEKAKRRERSKYGFVADSGTDADAAAELKNKFDKKFNPGDFARHYGRHRDDDSEDDTEDDSADSDSMELM